MTAKWSSNTVDQAASNNTDFSALFKDQYAVILLQGKNLFGDKIYSYVKVGMDQVDPLYAALKSGKNFNPSDFGTVVAAGRGQPDSTVKDEIASTYKMEAEIKPVKFPGSQPEIPEEKKNWDEY